MDDLFSLLNKKILISSLSNKKGSFVVDDTIGVALVVASNFKKNGGKYNVIASNLYNAQKVYDLLSCFIGEENCLFYPVDEMLRVESVASSKEMLAQRLFVMDELLKKDNYVLITHTASILRFLPSPELFKEKVLHFKIDNTYNIEDIKKVLIDNGYIRVNKIDQSMQFAIRGDIIDIFSVNNNNPIRMEFFDDTLESIRFFDIATQRSISKIDEISILPSIDIILSKDELNDFEDKINTRLAFDITNIDCNLVSSLKDIVSNDIEHIKNNHITESLYKYYGFIQNYHYSILDYSTNSINIVCNKEALLTTADILNKEVSDYFMDQYDKGFMLGSLSMYQSLNKVLSSHKTIYCSSFASSENDIVFNARSIVGGSNTIAGALTLIESYLDSSKHIILCLSTEHQKKAIELLLNDNEIEYEQIKPFDIPNKKIGICLFALENGFELVDQKIVYLSSRELLGYQSKMSRFLNRYKSAVILKSYQDLEPGDYVVHEKNGIGKFIDVETLEVDGIHRDYLHIQYADNGTLYVPVEQFKLIRKYIGKEGAIPKLNKLNSNEWDRTKKRIKERVNTIAEKLIELYATRMQKKGFAFKEDDEFQYAFESLFPFELTSGQNQAMEEIKKDMEADTPMDRLLCGDVGFGKTELAFRAAFKAINSGKQVALLCPTTLLARQHYERAMERFATFGIKIAIFSRLIPLSRQSAYLKGVEDGSIHFVIGTHKLLSNKIKYKDLGLLIIDEEQRFGVAQKEKIKELKTNVDVLTLSATPIPRTLQMSLIGIRSLSQLNSAPVNRMPIQTYVMPQDNNVIKELLERELARKGQVFYVHNNVTTIYEKATYLQSLVKDARIGIVHGQMEKDDIEDVMIKFYNGEIDILVCTSIIETGIDIPNANMIIIENADCFGLAQLYQIKGRVGRGNRIAYAYLLYKGNKNMNDDAKKRLKAIQEFTELGSGYKVAQRDLIIRGAGDILGPEQAGFIDSVGIDMYIQLLNEALSEKKGEEKELFSNQANKILSLDAYIPSSYINKGEKIDIYKEIDSAMSFDALNELNSKLKDIYGTLPKEVELLFTKRRIVLYQQEQWLKEVNEYKERIDLICTREFSKIDGMGYILFKELQKYITYLKVNFIKCEIHISFYKNGDWVDKYEDDNKILYNLSISKLS